ncbi:MAG: Grx4 family monothiol glutaredoxin [Spirochaetes bacterium]|nr:Grx4 family monothiol glutaredoxin [Spirochaetota bacterium]MBX3723476.1 Grx4 family monothiol glutaredoxin [Turneriella sp.]
MTIEEMKSKIAADVKENPVVLFMKGNKEFPQCGFSARVVQILNQHEANYVTRDVLSDPVLREAIKQFSDWPTLPQLYIKGEFVGGCDIVTEMAQKNELAPLLK